MQGSQLLTLKFSRSQETEADRLGIRYLQGAGYDPNAMSTVLASLAAQNSLDAQLQGRGDARLPEWASTHPDPASRVREAASLTQGMTGVTNTDTFLTRIDGLLYGDDPAQGVIEGRQFIHPELRLSFTAPQGFYMINGTSAVSIQGQGGQAQLSLAQYGGNLDSYVRNVFAKLGGNQQRLAPQAIQRTTINGIPAAYGTARVNSGNGQVDVAVFAYEFAPDRAYHFQAIAPAGRMGTFTPMFNSMRLEVVTVRSGDTVQSLSRRMAYTNGQEARFRVLNSLDSNAQLRAGQKVKLVVRGS